MGLSLKNPALSQDFIIMRAKLENMMYFCIIFGSHREIRQAIGQKDPVRFEQKKKQRRPSAAFLDIT